MAACLLFGDLVLYAQPSPTTTVLTSSQAPPSPVLTLTATVSAAMGGPVTAGQVQFLDGKLTLGTVQGVAQPNGSLVANLRTRSLVPISGLHGLTARFLGARYSAFPTAASTSSPLPILWLPGFAAAPTISLSSGVDSLSATVNASTALNGTVTFLDQTAGVQLGAVALPSSSGAPSLTFSETSPFSTGVEAGPMVVADFNQDGIPDLAAIDNSGAGNTVSVWLGDPANPGQFLAPTVYTVGNGLAQIVAADLNADGFVDIAVGASDGTTATITLLFGDPSHPGRFLSGAPIVVDVLNAPGVTLLFDTLIAADFNGDGLPDLLYSIGQELALPPTQGGPIYSGGQVYVLLNSASAPGVFPTTPPASGAVGAPSVAGPVPSRCRL